jgi:hypothetical protein
MNTSNNGMVGLNGAARPHLYTADTRLGEAIAKARRLYPQSEGSFRWSIVNAVCLDMSDCWQAFDETETHWMLWRHEYLARPLGERLAESMG